jgi:hypothetical protein
MVCVSCRRNDTPKLTQLLVERLKQTRKERLQELESWLLKMPERTLQYAVRMRDIQHQLTTIDINTKNFESELSQLQGVALKDVDDLAFLERFLSQECQKYRQQAVYNLEYLATGHSLFDQTIAAIRGQVEIEGQKQQDENYDAEQRRSRKLTILVAMVGAGLSVTSISSSGVGQKVVQYVLDNFGIESTEKTVSRAIWLYLSNLLFHALVGGICAIGAGGLFWWFTRHSKGKP